MEARAAAIKYNDFEWYTWFLEERVDSMHADMNIDTGFQCVCLIYTKVFSFSDAHSFQVVREQITTSGSGGRVGAILNPKRQLAGGGGGEGGVCFDPSFHHY